VIVVMRVQKWTNLAAGGIDCAGLYNDKSIGFLTVYKDIKEAREGWPNLPDSAFQEARENKIQEATHE
jgi:hypothetical protein